MRPSPLALARSIAEGAAGPVGCECQYPAIAAPPARATLCAAINAAGSISKWVRGVGWTLRTGTAVSIRSALPSNSPHASS